MDVNYRILRKGIFTAAVAAGCVLGTVSSSTAATNGTVDVPSGEPAIIQGNSNPSLTVPGYGPGVAGFVFISPVCPRSQPACPTYVRPYADADVLVLDASRQTVAEAISNSTGNFIVSVPAGTYTLHIRTVDFPLCPEVQPVVEQTEFTLEAIHCTTQIP
jgi:hypothetical protein